MSQNYPNPKDPAPRKREEESRTRMGSSITAPNQAVKPRQEATRISSAVRPVSPRPAPKQTPEPKKQERKKPEKKSEGMKGIGGTAVRALIYIAVVVAISTLLSVFAIRWANDVFALVKEEKTESIVIEENASLSEVSRLLGDKGLIRYPLIFRLYETFKHRNDETPLAFRPGTYEISSSLNYDQMISIIKLKKTRTIVKLTIPEGYTVNEIIEFFLKEGIGTRKGFEEAINEFPYEYRFMEELNKLELSSDRRYRLEGYLFPDTYEFYTDSSEVAVIDKMLAAFEAKFQEPYYARVKEMGYNLDQIITMASLVQGEGYFASEFSDIAGVFYNRLKSWNPKYLNSDACIQYILNAHKEDLTQEDIRIDNPYNTYNHEGLPPSAICNPGWDAILAALYPETHNYYYFVSDTDGSTIFATTYAQHLNNVAAVDAAREKGTHAD